MKYTVRFLLHLPFIACLSSTVGFSAAAQPSSPTPVQEKARAQLRAAATAGSEADLQRVEITFSRTEEAALARLLRGYLRLQAKDYTTAATLLGDEMIGRSSALGDYALYYRGQALQEAGRGEEAEREFRRLAGTYPSSLLARAAVLQAAGSAMLRGAYPVVINDLARLVEAGDATALKLKADALEKLGRNSEAIETLRKIYFEAPQSAEAGTVGERLAALGSSTAATDPAMLRTRADRLYQAGLYVLAGQAYDQLARQFPAAASDEVSLRAGISHFKAKVYQPALDALSRVRARTPKEMSETLYYLGAAHRALRHEAQMLQALADLRRAAPNSSHLGAMLYEIGQYYEKNEQPAQAATYYQQLVRDFPRDERADEAQFSLAWRAHQAKDYRQASQLLIEHLANYGEVTDNRGKAAFWAAMDSERAGERARALTLYRALLRRYGAGWYGFNAERHIEQLEKAGVKAPEPESDSLLARAVAKLQTIAPIIETIKPEDRERVEKAEQLALIALHQTALNELEAAHADAPNSPIVNLRIAQVFRARNEAAAAINALRRAYPDYGQALPAEMPREVWEVFYPLNWWETIKQEARRYHLDPYLVAGLIRQESIFNPQARSRANALGLMQLLPSTGRFVARKYSLGGGTVTAADLYNPTLNIQLGTAYLSQLIEQFGRFEYVAAAYNGGPTRVVRWLRELPAGEIEDWVESIPISETRGYVAGVYRNARQYQRLYDEQGRFKEQ
jgi:soluble lytic murein transglycosylase